MKTAEIINILKDMNKTNFNSIALPWQPSLICGAQTLNNVTDSNGNSILPFVKALSAVQIESGTDMNNAKYFCFIPLSSNRWRVYVLSRFRCILAQLEDYNGDILANNVSVVNSFVLSID